MDLSSLASEVELESTLDRVCGDIDLLIELLTMLIDEFRRDQAEMTVLLETQDYTWLRTKAHHHKGVGANLGLVNFTAAAKNLETAAQSSDQAKCKAAFQDMVDTTLRVGHLMNQLAR